VFASKAQRLRSWAPAHRLDAEAETALKSGMQPEGCKAKTALLERAVSHCEWRISEDSEWARSARAEHVRSTKKKTVLSHCSAQERKRSRGNDIDDINLGSWFLFICQAITELRRRAENVDGPKQAELRQRIDNLADQLDLPELPSFLGGFARSDSISSSRRESTLPAYEHRGEPRYQNERPPHDEQLLPSRSHSTTRHRGTRGQHEHRQREQKARNGDSGTGTAEQSDTERLTEEVSQLTKQLSESVKNEREAVQRSKQAAEQAESAMERSAAAIKSSASRAAHALTDGKLSLMSQISTIALIMLLFLFAVLLIRLSPVQK